MADEKREPVIRLNSLIEELEDLADNPDGARADAIVHYMGLLSRLVDEGEVRPDEYPSEFERLRRATKAAREIALDYEWLLKQFEAYRKDFPKTHWWWYPEEW